METLFNSDESFKKKVLQEYKSWAKEDKKPSSKKKGTFRIPEVLASESEVDEFYEQYSHLFDEERFQLGQVEPSGYLKDWYGKFVERVAQDKVSDSIRKTAYGVGLQYEAEFADRKSVV